jgi:CubicO group peptidase (beta-lactamase class C family)
MGEMQKLLQAAMDRAVENKELAGVSALVIKDGQEICFAKSGYADIAGGREMERDTIVHLYSQSKPITAAAAMLLVQDGIIDMNQPVGDFIDSFKKQEYFEDGIRRPVPEDKLLRISDLLNMTSGLCYPGATSETEVLSGYLFYDLIKRFERCDTAEDANDYLDAPNLGLIKESPVDTTKGMMSTLEFAEEIGKIPLAFIPGSHFKYGTSADVLGAVIEKASGMPFGEFLKKRLFEPLDMKDTFFVVPEDKLSRMSKIYKSVHGELKEFHGNRLGVRSDGGENAFESGGAGLFSTLDDYAHFGQMLLNGGSYNGKEILRPRMVEYFINGSLTDAQQKDLENWHGLEGYTYGNLMRVLRDPSQAVIVGNKGEYGWDGWLGCFFMNDPATKTTFIMMTQRFDYGTGPVTRKLRNIIMNQI